MWMELVLGPPVTSKPVQVSQVSGQLLNEPPSQDMHILQPLTAQFPTAGSLYCLLNLYFFDVVCRVFCWALGINVGKGGYMDPWKEQGLYSQAGLIVGFCTSLAR